MRFKTFDVVETGAAPPPRRAELVGAPPLPRGALARFGSASRAFPRARLRRADDRSPLVA